VKFSKEIFCGKESGNSVATVPVKAKILRTGTESMQRPLFKKKFK
jgi:hypothetical protein